MITTSRLSSASPSQRALSKIQGQSPANSSRLRSCTKDLFLTLPTAASRSSTSSTHWQSNKVVAVKANPSTALWAQAWWSDTSMVNEHLSHSTNPRIYHLFLPFLPSTIHYLFFYNITIYLTSQFGFYFRSLTNPCLLPFSTGFGPILVCTPLLISYFLIFTTSFSKLNWTKETLYTVKDIFLQSIYTLYLKAYPAVLVSPPAAYLRIPNAETPN